MDDMTDWRNAQLRAITDLTNDVRLFEIAPEGAFIAPAPGGHINVMVWIDGRSVVRSYSVFGPVNDGVYRLAIKRLPDSRGGSAYMWTLQPGARLSIAGPANHFELRRGRPEYLLVAGGIGITPIYAMAQALVAAGEKLRLLYACRTTADFALAGQLRALLGDRLELFASAQGQRLDIAAAMTTLAPDGEMYVCGPIAMLEEARSVWRASGRPVDHLRFETFGNSGRYPSAPFTVHLPHLNRTVQVAKNQTLLEGLEAAGIDAMFDCRRGECGLCAVNIIAMDGVIDHRDVFFSEEEKAQGHKLCACVSRMAGGSVTIDTGERR